MVEIAHLASRSEGGTGFQPVTCGSHSQDGCATLKGQGRGNRGSRTAQARAVMGGIQPSLLRAPPAVSSQMIIKVSALTPLSTSHAQERISPVCFDSF